MVRCSVACWCLVGMHACTPQPAPRPSTVPVPPAPTTPASASVASPPAAREIAGTVTTLATGMTNPGELVVDEGHVWLCSFTALVRLEKHRAAPALTIDVGGHPVDIADRGPSLAVSVHQPPNGWLLVEVDKRTLTTRTLTTGLEAQHIALTGSEVVAADATGRIAAVGGGQREVASGQGYVSDIVAGAGKLCWASGGDLGAAMMAGKPLPGSVTCADPSGANAAVLARPVLPVAVALTPSLLAYADSEGVHTLRGAGPPVRIHESAGTLFAVTALAADERDVVFGLGSVTGDAPGKLMRLSPNDVGARELARFSGAATALGMDERAVYVSNMQAGSVARVAR